MLLFLSLAFADDATLAACCRAGGAASCPTKLQVRTEKSALDSIGLGWDVAGVWSMSCSGVGKFDANAELESSHEPGFGEVLTPDFSPLAAHCFAQACALPNDVCISAAGNEGAFALVGCGDALPVNEKALGSAPGTAPGKGAKIVVLDGKPLVATAQVVDAPVRAPPAESQWSDLAATAAPTSWTISAPPSAVPTPSAPGPVAAPSPVALSLPNDPPDPCTPAPDAVRAEARKRVGTGDDYRIVGKSDLALGDYKAALTMDKCNGYAWMSLAQMANDQQRTDLAIRALRNTTRLLPSHPGAFLMLGKALESFGQQRSAAEAYKRATELAPSNAEAIEGYMRTRG